MATRRIREYSKEEILECLKNDDGWGYLFMDEIDPDFFKDEDFIVECAKVNPYIVDIKGVMESPAYEQVLQISVFKDPELVFKILPELTLNRTLVRLAEASVYKKYIEIFEKKKKYSAEKLERVALKYTKKEIDVYLQDASKCLKEETEQARTK